VQCVRISPATVRIARRRRVLRTGVMGVRVWVRARGRSAAALPGIVRAPAPRLVRARVMRVRRGGLVMVVVVMVARLVLWGAAVGCSQRTIVRSSTAAYALSRQNFEDIGRARGGRGKGEGSTYRCLSFPRTAYASLNARNFSLASGSLLMSGWNCLLNYTVFYISSRDYYRTNRREEQKQKQKSRVSFVLSFWFGGQCAYVRTL
jgi:hypothetical protein